MRFMKKLNRFWYSALLLFALASQMQASDSTSTWHAGPAFRKYVGFYWVNGATAEWQNTGLRKHKLVIGFTALHSALGTDLVAKAIPTLNVELALIRKFKFTKAFGARVALHTGYANAAYGNATFNKIGRNAPLAGLEFGLEGQCKKWQGTATLGYQGISGAGTKGLATVFPIYLQMRVFYLISSLKKN